MLVLDAKPRDIKQNPSALRKTGMVPAVFYGRKEKSASVSISEKDFLKIWKQAGESSIINLKGADKEDKQVLIHDVSRDPVTGRPIHVDFYCVEKDKKLRINVPIEFTGVSPAVKDFGGILVKVLHELEIESLPKDLPRGVTVDISSLVALNSQILAKDISLPKEVVCMTGADEVVAAVSVAKEEVEEVAPADLSQIEVEKKGKEVVEGEGEVPTEKVAAKTPPKTPAEKSEKGKS